MNNRSNIFYQSKLSEQLIKLGSFDALTMFYLLKTTHSNSIIYNYDNQKLFERLKATGLIPRNFKYSRFVDIFNTLEKHSYFSYTNEGHLKLLGLHKEKCYYTSKITYKKHKITFKIMKALLIKEQLKRSANKQQYAVKLKHDMTTHSKKAYARFKRQVKHSKKNGSFKPEGESYTCFYTYTYRAVAKNNGLSLSNTYNLISFLKKNKGLKTQTITETKHLNPLGCNQDLVKDIIKDKLNIKSYFYFGNKGQIVCVLGTAILSF